MGNLSDPIGRRPLLLLAIFGLGVDYLFSALAPIDLLAVRGPGHRGALRVVLCDRQCLYRRCDRARGPGKAFGLMGAAFGVGFVVGPAIGGLLGEFGPRVPFYVAAAISALNFVYGWFVLPETCRRKSAGRSTGGGPTRSARSRSFAPTRACCRCAGCCSCSSSPLRSIRRSGRSGAWRSSAGARRWSGLTLAAFGIIAAFFQGVLTGPVVDAVRRTPGGAVGLIIAVIAAVGYGLVGTLAGGADPAGDPRAGRASCIRC